MALQDVVDLKEVKGSMMEESEAQKTPRNPGTQNVIGMESEPGPRDRVGTSSSNLLPLHNGVGWYYDLANDKLSSGEQASDALKADNESRSPPQDGFSASEMAAKGRQQPSRGGKPGAPAPRNLLYQSI